VTEIGVASPSDPKVQPASQTNPKAGREITAGPDGNVWFVETAVHGIGMMNTSDPSHPIQNFNNSNAPGLPNDAQPVTITAGPDSQGNRVLWFIDIQHNALGMISPSNPTGITEISLPANLVGVTGFQPQIVAGPGGWLYFTEMKSDLSGIIASAIGAYHPADNSWAEGQLTGTAKQQPFGITLGPDNNVWFTAAVPISGSFDFQSSAVGTAGLPGAGGSIPITESSLTSPASDNTLFPYQIIAGPDGNLWFDWTTRDPSGSGGGIGSINPGTKVIAPPLLIPTSVVSIPHPAGITAGPDGNVWFVDSSGALGRVTLDTSLQITTQPPASVAAGSPFGLKVGVVYSSTGAPYSGNVTVSLQANPGGSTLGGTTTVTASGGVAAFSGLTLNNAGNGYTLQVTAPGATAVTTGFINVTSATTTATHLVVIAPPPGTVVAGSPFGLTVYAETNSNVVDPSFNGPVTIALVGGSLSGTTTVMAVNGKATFSGLILNNVGNGYTLQAMSTGLASVTTPPITVTPAQPAPPLISREIPVFNQKTNKRGKPVGKPTLAGFEFDFNKPMNQGSVDSAGSYQVGAYVNKRVKRKNVKVLQPVGFSAVSNASNSSVRLLISGRQNFSAGGQITLIASGIASADGAFLASNAVFMVSANGRAISRVS
jgi:streptogramin lyase